MFNNNQDREMRISKPKIYTLGLSLCVCGLLGASLRAQDKTKAAAYNGPKDKLHLYLLIGQSNMAGRAPYTREESKVIERCYLLNDKDQWKPAKNPLNRYSTIRKGLGMQKMNPGYSFAKAILAKNKGISLGLVVNAKGGTKIEQWKKGTRFYKEALRRTKAAQQEGVIKGILWHQGESNKNNPDGYLDKLKSLIENIRKDLNEPRLPFVAGQVNNVPRINEQIADLPQAVPFTGFVSSEGLKTMDRWHFDAASMKLLGQRYAEEMGKVQTKLKAK
ncbi:MAG: sialate O-acetylesterase [Lentisphaeria bacterium]